jgi:hypothetical protein
MPFLMKKRQKTSKNVKKGVNTEGSYFSNPDQNTSAVDNELSTADMFLGNQLRVRLKILIV